MSIYTRYGDQGYTRLVGGKKVSKSSPRVYTYGSIDTLNSQIGVTVAQLERKTALRDELVQLQQWVFDCGSDFATPEGQRPYKLTVSIVSWLEKKIDAYWSELPEIDRFTLPGGTMTAANLQLCRCFTREAERHAVCLLEQKEQINLEALKFLNRLSDYFYALARWVNHQEAEPEIFYTNSVPVFQRKKVINRSSDTKQTKEGNV